MLRSVIAEFSQFLVQFGKLFMLLERVLFIFENLSQYLQAFLSGGLPLVCGSLQEIQSLCEL